MTDPGTADRTYIGPMTPELVEQILDKASPLSFYTFLEHEVEIPESNDQCSDCMHSIAGET